MTGCMTRETREATRAVDSGEDLAERAGSFLGTVGVVAPLPGFVRHTPAGEAWFSDHLAWLLDPRGSHGLGRRFADGFVATLARIRTEGRPDDAAPDRRYGRRRRYLRRGRGPGRGTPATRFHLGNAAVFREFYLAQRVVGRRAGRAMFCDLVLLDLDPRDGLFVAIENKLFTTDHDDQLARYHEIIEAWYHRARVVEYVYLTLFGDAPVFPVAASPACRRAWLRVSWVHDVLPILDGLAGEADLPDGARELQAILRWFAAVRSRTDTAAALMDEVVATLGAAVAEILLDELQRLGAFAPGHWRLEGRGHRQLRLRHSSRPRAALNVGVLPNLSIVLDSRRRGDRGSGNRDKLLIPSGANVDQLCDLVDLVARDVYGLHFGDGAGRYLGRARRQRSAVREVRRRWRPFLAFVHEHRHELQLLANLGRVGT